MLLYSCAFCVPGIATPMPGPSKGTYTLIVDESGKKASWTLELCDVPQYVASHLHIVSFMLCLYPLASKGDV